MRLRQKTARSGRESVSLKPELVVLDLSMPIMNGIEAAREIRKKAPATKIVISRCTTRRESRKKRFKQGADA